MPVASRPSLGSTRERDRLEHRTRRMERVIRELRGRADERRRHDGHVPAPLGLAIRGFEDELRRMRRRLGA
jgi:hypothetical protein